jgi:glycosyltransferase involved in cell wall biosynthesis
LRICIVSAALPEIACGIGDYTHRLATALAAAGAEPVVVTAARPGLRSDLPYEVRTVSTRWRLADAASVSRAVSRTRPDIVHIQFPGSGYGRGFGVTALPWVLLAAHPRLPVALTFHEFDRLSRRHRLRLAAGALPCRLIVAPGADLAGAVGRYLGRRPGLRIAEIPLASNVIPAQRAELAPEEFHRDPGELIVGYWGFLRPDKGIEALIESFARVRAVRRARLVIAGDPGPDAAYARRVDRLIELAGLEDDTLRTGPLPADRLSPALLGLDVCVFPFRSGLTSNRTSYAAAVAHGLSIVTTSRTARGFDEGTNTRFVDPGDVTALGDAILEAAGRPRLRVATDPASEWASIARRHLELYREVLGR